MTSIVPFPRSVVQYASARNGLFRLLAGFGTKLGRIASTKPAAQFLPDDLLADVLSDNGLRAREETRRRPIVSGPWS